jgi:hypothetical protein
MTSHHYLTLDDKIVLINDYADGARLSQHELCEKYKVSKGAVYSILQPKDEYKHRCHMQTARRVGSKDRWNSLFVVCGAEGKKHSHTLWIFRVFKASNGWIDKFKNRHDVTLRVLSDESAQVDSNTVEEKTVHSAELICRDLRLKCRRNRPFFQVAARSVNGLVQRYMQREKAFKRKIHYSSVCELIYIILISM